MNKNVYSYRTTDTLGKSQLDLIIQVYDGALKSFGEARAHYEKDETNEGFDKLQKARRFLTHLYTTLDVEKGGEVAENLGKLYAYVINQTHVVEATKELKLIDDSIEILKNLRSGWALLKQSSAEAPGESPEASEEPAEPAGHINASG